MKKIRVWDSKTLSDVYAILGQIQTGIESIVNNVGAQSLNDLPNSMIPTSSLYEICLCYELIYNKLLEYDLLSTGNQKLKSTVH